MSVPSNFSLPAFGLNGDTGISAINKRGYDANATADLIGPTGAINSSEMITALNDFIAPSGLLNMDKNNPKQVQTDKVQVNDLIGVLAMVDPTDAKKFTPYSGAGVDSQAASALQSIFTGISTISGPSASTQSPIQMDTTKIETKYGTLYFSGPFPSLMAKEAYASGFVDMMKKWGPLMGSGQVPANAHDVVMIGQTVPNSDAETGNKVTTVTYNNSGINSITWNNIAAHETGWDMESSEYDSAVTKKAGAYGYTNNMNGFLTEEVDNYLQRQAVPGLTYPLSKGEQAISGAIHSGIFTITELAQAFYGGNVSATNKILNSFSSATMAVG